MTEATLPEGPDVSRRDFVKTVAGTALVSTLRPSRDSTAAATTEEAPVARFYKTLTDDQKARICFPHDHPLRSQVHNNWAIVEPSIDDLTAEQKTLCDEVFKGLCSDGGRERFLRQMAEDYGGFGNYHVAVFGQPGTDKPFEWVLTGRHATLRADGNRPTGASFGGPVFYGHASQGLHEDARHTGNVWWYQAERANAIFKTLSDDQKVRALVSAAEPAHDRTVKPRGDRPVETGLPVVGLDGLQKELVRKLLNDLLMPFRISGDNAAPFCTDSAACVDGLRLTYFQEGDLGSDGVWDVWKLEGSAFSWYFHGSPHVHAWVSVARTAS